MSKSITAKIDLLIEEYKADHRGDLPLYIIISSDDAELLIEDIRKFKKYTKDILVTTYRNITIAKNDMFTKGKILLSNELPETGS